MAPVPEPEHKETPRAYEVSESFILHLRTLLYCWLYLFRLNIEQFYKLMVSLESPMAPRFHDAVHDMNLAMLEHDLNKLGFPVKDLDCYKHWALTHDAA